jgi:hypothetical protein
MRTPVISGVFLFLLSACSGDDLLLPGAAPAQLRAVSGDGQTAQAGDPLRHPLVVEVLDRSGRPIPGTAVVFAFLDPAAGAEISTPTAATDASGRASAEVTLGNAVGDQPVVARLSDSGSDLSVQFLLTALRRPDPPSPPLSPPPTNGGGGGDDSGSGGGGGAGPAPPPSNPPPPEGGGGKDKGKDKGKGKDGEGNDDHGGHGRGKDQGGDRHDDD